MEGGKFSSVGVYVIKTYKICV